MSRAALVALLALAAGCLGVDAQGDETLVLRNERAEPTRLNLEIRTVGSGVPVVAEDVVLAAGESRELVVALDAGRHEARVATTHGIVERSEIVVPSRGDSTIEVVVTDAGVSLVVKGR